MIENRARAVDVERRVVFLRDACERNAFAIETARRDSKMNARESVAAAVTLRRRFSAQERER